jgi:hypothetical protein
MALNIFNLLNAAFLRGVNVRLCGTHFSAGSGVINLCPDAENQSKLSGTLVLNF